MSPQNILLPLFFLLFLVGCDTSARKPIAHLKLDSTDLIVEVVANNLDVPWDIEPGPDGWIWFNEQKGSVSRLNLASGNIEHLLTIPDVYQKRSTGLFSLVLHPQFTEVPHLFVHYTYLAGTYESYPLIKSRIVRYTFNGKALVDPLIILDEIPGGNGHNGSRMIISEDLKLFFASGDNVDGRQSQDIENLAGKILRLNLDGSIPQDNPFSNNLVYSYGQRNPQGLTHGPNGMIFESEHGPERNDEINIIRKGANYGWPGISGFIDTPYETTLDETLQSIGSIAEWTPTIATAGIAYFDHPSIPEWQNSILLGTLKNQSFRVLSLTPDHSQITEERIYLQPTLGRIRDMFTTANGEIYLATSNHDWHPRFFKRSYEGFPQSDDDKIIRIRKIEAAELKKIQALHNIPTLTEQENIVGEPTRRGRSGPSGEDLYANNCAACHMPEGEGIPGVIPPLRQTTWVTDRRRSEEYISAVLFGIDHPIEVLGETYNQPMPSFADLLTDREIARVLSYVRNNFGNEGGWVDTDEVEAIRNSKASD